MLLYFQIILLFWIHLFVIVCLHLKAETALDAPITNSDDGKFVPALFWQTQMQEVSVVKCFW
jgi:hypothetical protein